MEYKFKFETEEEKNELIKNKNDEGLFLIEVQYLFEGNYLIFSDKEIIHEPTEIEIMQNEIKALREELTQIQISIASLTSLIAATLEEK